MVPASLLNNQSDPILEELQSPEGYMACCEIITPFGVAHLVADSRAVLFEILCRIRQTDLELAREVQNQSQPEGVILINVKKIVLSDSCNRHKSSIFKVNKLTRALLYYYDFEPGGRHRLCQDLRNQEIVKVWDLASDECDGQIERLLEADTFQKISALKTEFNSLNNINPIEIVGSEVNRKSPTEAQEKEQAKFADCEGKDLLRKLMITAESSNEEKTDYLDKSQCSVKIKNLFSEEFNSGVSEVESAILEKSGNPSQSKSPLKSSSQMTIQPLMNVMSHALNASHLWDKLFFLENKSLASNYPPAN